MTKREFRLLLWALFARTIGLLAAFSGILALLLFAERIIGETGGGDTVKTVLGAAIAVFAGAALQLANGLGRDYTEFITSMRQQNPQEEERRKTY